MESSLVVREENVVGGFSPLEWSVRSVYVKRPLGGLVSRSMLCIEPSDRLGEELSSWFMRHATEGIDATLTVRVVCSFDKRMLHEDLYVENDDTRMREYTQTVSSSYFTISDDLSSLVADGYLVNRLRMKVEWSSNT